MKNKYKAFLRTFLFLFILLNINLLLNAQSSRDYGWYFNVNFGLTQAYCDLQEDNNFISKLSDETKFGYGIQLAKYISPIFALRAQVLKAEMKGSKYSVDAYFNADVLEYQLNTSVNFSNIFFGINHERTVSVYGVAGIGMLYFRSESRKISNGEVINRYGYKDNGDKDKRSSSIFFPIGMGVNFRLSKKLSINFESVLRFMDTDDVDATDSGPHKDAFFYASLGLSYNLFKKKKREKIEMPSEIIAEITEDTLITEKIDLIYDLPKQLVSNSEFDMKFTIIKDKIDGLGELMQILPIGFTVLDTVFENAKFEFKNFTVNLIWDELPADTSFTMTYRVKVEDVYGNLPITSILYIDKTGKEYKFKRNIYVEKERFEEEIVISDTVITEEIEEPKDVLEFKVQVRAAYKAKISLQRLANKYHLRDSIREDFVGNWYRYSVGSFATFAEAKEYRKIIVADHKVLDAFVVVFRNGVRLNSLSELKELKPSEMYEKKTKYIENGLMYRVQILALLHNKVSPEALKDIYKVEKDINEEKYERWRKYTVGDFTSIKEAEKYRDLMKEKGITDAFVVIYKNGERISIDKPL
ncbi:MAG: outer membrane beta-barrel protein [Bacteroidales bacterium]|nr:outer membrane beta-barrel protein [Bacteroidales bacterium]